MTGRAILQRGLGAALAVCAATAAVASALAAGTDDARVLTVVLENDVFYDTDRHYTNGVRASWAGTPQGTPKWADAIAQRLPVYRAGATVRTLFTLGQNMYTPDDISLESPPLDDRPYAGWTYFSVGLLALTESDAANARAKRPNRLDQLELWVGVIGPASFAEDVQKFVHKTIDATAPKGWHTQLGNEPAVLLSYQYAQRDFVDRPLGSFDFDATPTIGFAFGNVFIQAAGGITFRLGHNIASNDYGAPRIQPSLPGSAFLTGNDSLSWYVFRGVEGRLVGHNVFLDGNTLGNSRSVDTRRLVGDIQFGAVASWHRLRLTYTHVLRSREFRGQPDRDDFGAVSLSVRF